MFDDTVVEFLRFGGCVLLGANMALWGIEIMRAAVKVRRSRAMTKVGLSLTLPRVLQPQRRPAEASRAS